MNPKVSIIINNFNYAEYLKPCIKSAINQTYENIEVIVSDDGSTDDSRVIIESFGSSIIKVFKRNGGQASALNAGYKKSSGDLVIFLDSDDILWPSCVSEVVRHWRSGLMKLHFNLAVIDASGDSTGSLYLKPPLPHGDFREQLLNEGTVPSMPTSGNVFPRAFLNQVMPMPEAGWERDADAYIFNLAALSGQVGAIDEPLGGYRVHGNNVSGMLKDGKLNKIGLRKFLQREILTDQSLAAYGQKIGVRYRPGTLTGSLPHIQQLFVHEKLFKEDHCFGETNIFKQFIIYLKLLLTAKTLSLYKKPIIAGWSFVVMLLPKSLAQPLVVMGYQFGVILAAKRIVARP
ncbi:MAG TPA: glycosyltransferase [Chthoniobacterales bacterium]|nr:glycosyltransferase [Chthoniobacterales bacterium]